MIPHFIFVGVPLCYKGNTRFSGEVHCWLVELLLLIEGSFITCFFLLKEFSSHVSTYCGNSLCPLIEGFFITCFFLLKEFSLSFLKRFYHLFLLIEGIFFVCSLIFFWSIQSCSLTLAYSWDPPPVSWPSAWTPASEHGFLHPQSSLTSLWLKRWFS